MKITAISISHYFCFKIYVFIGCGRSSLLHIGLPLVVVSESYSLLWCTGFSFPWILSCEAEALGAWASVVAVHGLRRHRLSHATACGIFPDQVSNLCPLHWKAYSYRLDHQGSPQSLFQIFN